jgi:hypothetical protein
MRRRHVTAVRRRTRAQPRLLCTPSANVSRPPAPQAGASVGGAARAAWCTSAPAELDLLAAVRARWGRRRCHNIFTGYLLASKRFAPHMRPGYKRASPPQLACQPAPPDAISSAASQHHNLPLWPSPYPSSLTTSPRVSFPRSLFTCIAAHLTGIRAVAAALPRSRHRRSPELPPVTPPPPIDL